MPSLPWPPHDGFVASPVTFEWDPVIDPNVGDVYLSVRDENDEYVITDVYGINATKASPFGLKEGRYDSGARVREFLLDHEPGWDSVRPEQERHAVAAL